jgi:hypothetical protein
MTESKYRVWDVLVKVAGFLATALSIWIGIHQFADAQRAASELELNKNFWNSQNTVYTELCKNAGAMAASIDDQKVFAAQKTNFLTHYYGEMVLVEDQQVTRSMISVKAYLDVFVWTDPDMRNILKRKILELSEACRNSSLTFKRSNLK